MRLRSGNPTLGDSTFETVYSTSADDVMTLGGTVNKTAVLLFLVVAAASITWINLFRGDTGLVMPLTAGGAMGGLVLALVTTFKKTWSPVTAPLYAVCEGLFLGGISALFEMRMPGIVLQATALTFGTAFALLSAYKSGVIRATENFKLGVVAATGGIALIYLASMLMNLFGFHMPYIHDSGVFGIGFSLFVVVIAALNLVMDFDFIERGAELRSPKYMEWYGAFGLIVTLVWLYLEILRLLAKLREE